MILSGKFLVQNMERISVFNLETGALEYILDDLQNATMNNEQETVYATGKNGVRIGASDRNKASRISGSNGTIVGGLLASQVGWDIEDGEVTAPMFTELSTTDGSTITLDVKASGTTGNEIGYIYKRNSDGTVGKRYEQAATASATEFAFDASTNTITLPTGEFEAGESIYAFVEVKAENGRLISNFENRFSKTHKVVADIWVKDTCTDKSYLGIIIYYKAKASGNFDLTFGDDMSVHNFEFEALSGGCNAGDGKKLWDFIIFDGDDVKTDSTTP